MKEVRGALRYIAASARSTVRSIRSNPPDAQMHPAPLRVHARADIVLVDVTTQDELEQHDPEQGREGRDETQQVSEEPGDHERREASGPERSDVDEVCHAENRQEHWEIQDHREEDLQGGEISDGEHLGRGLIAPGGVRVGLHLSCGGPAGVWRPPRADGDLACRVAFAEERPERHHPSCSLESLCQTRDEDRVPPDSANPSSGPSGVSNTALQIASTSSQSASKLSAGCSGVAFPCPADSAPVRASPRATLRLQREVWQTPPVNLS